MMSVISLCTVNIHCLRGFFKGLLSSATKLRKLCFYTCLSVHRVGGGVCLSACWDTTPPGAGTFQTRYPPEQTLPREQAPPGSRHPPRTRYSPEQKPIPRTRPPQQTATVADSTHPTGMHSCLW